MKFGNIVEGRFVRQTRETVYEDETGSLRLTVAIPSTTDYNKVVARYGIGGSRPDWKGYIRHVAQSWFVGMDGATDANGAVLPDDAQHRALVLDAKQDILVHLTEFLRGAMGDKEEGKAISGTD